MGESNGYFDPYGVLRNGEPQGYRTAARPEFAPGYGREEEPPGPPDLDVLDRSWDIEAELAQLLRDTGAGPEHAPPGEPAEPPWLPEDEAPPPPPGRPGEGAPRHRSLRPRHRRRQRRQRRRGSRPEVVWLHLISFTIAALTATIVAMVSVLGGLVSYDPLRHLVGPHVPIGLARWWPLLVYGPWLAASLSILRATLLRRRARHSWFVVVLFSAVAVVLCVGHAPKTLSGLAAAGLPPITALACFQQLVSQITLTQPRHALPRDHNGLPRQRTPTRRRSGKHDAGRG